MSTPMHDVPEHLLMGVDGDGNGPVTEYEAHHIACWCACPHSVRPVPPDPGEVRQIAVHPAAWGWLQAMLAHRGFRLGQIPVEDGEVPTYIMVPTDLEGS